MRTVSTGGLTALLVDDSPEGTFCCTGDVKDGPANTGLNDGTSRCGFPDRENGYDPFSLSTGLPVYNRSDGSTGQNKSQASTSATDGRSPQCTAAGRASTSTVAVGAGVGVSLGVLWLATLAFLIWKWM